jgi:subtilisin family serine protease
MGRTSGRREVRIGLIDGPVALDHPALADAVIDEIPGKTGACTVANSTACRHGTFVAGILSAARGADAPGICPDCTLLVRPVFDESALEEGMPSARPEELAAAILDCVGAGARVVNVSAALIQPTFRSEREVEDALDRASAAGAIVVVAAGNQGALRSTSLTRHPGVIPVIAYDLLGTPMNRSNLGRSIGVRGLGAPGEQVTSLSSAGEPLTLNGTSAAAPFVTGAIALLWSEFPAASASEVRRAVARTTRRSSVVPPLLDAGSSYQSLFASNASTPLERVSMA